jgi:hypothetical protein
MGGAVKGLPLALAGLLAAGCGSFLVGSDPAATDRGAVFEQVWQDLDRHYSFFVSKGIDWDSLHDVYVVPARQAATDRALADAIGAMLAELRDVHVDLFTPGRTYRYTGYDSLPAFFDPQLVHAQYVTDLRNAPNGRLQFGRAASDVGYLWIPSFGGSGFGADLDVALAQLAGVRALIVDVRNNGGGNNQNGLEIAARFADRSRTYGAVRYRSGPRHDDFTPPLTLTVSPGGRRFSGPVTVLTNRRDASSTEDFVLAMRVLPTVTVVGDTTLGAFGNPLTRELVNGWTYRFSQWIEYGPDGTSYEAIGLAPGVWVRGSAAELQNGHDAILDSALARVMTMRFSTPGRIRSMRPGGPLVRLVLPYRWIYTGTSFCSASVAARVSAS